MTEVIKSLADISDRYDALFVDLWGCVHNGIKAFSSANESLKNIDTKVAKLFWLQIHLDHGLVWKSS